GPPKPDSVLVTLKFLSTLTVTSVPSDLRICASYGDPSESVSTLMIVAPGTALSAAARTLLAVPSVSRVSSGPWPILAGSAPFGTPDRHEDHAVTGAAAQVVRQRQLLSFSQRLDPPLFRRFVSQLQPAFKQHPQAARTDRMAERFETAVRIHREIAVEVVGAG